MVIREGGEGDIPSIVALLKMSLGESLMPKSASYWRWKHIDNPFGASPVLLAWEDDILVGVRAFMRWQWKDGNNVYEAVRAVDTATHPDYQGRGIFKKLTLSLLDLCRQKGWHFVFNTPNENSKPGYLKMGWKEAGKLPITIRVVKPLSMALTMAHLKRPSVSDVVQTNTVQYYVEHPQLSELLRQSASRHQGNMVTVHTPGSLAWRYADVIVAQYFACGVEAEGRLDALVFYRMKASAAGNEFRITDVFMGSHADEKQVRRAVAERVKAHRADYVTISGCHAPAIAKGLFTVGQLRVGPIVTTRDIADSATGALQGFHGWSPSLGDLELF